MELTAKQEILLSCIREAKIEGVSDELPDGVTVEDYWDVLIDQGYEDDLNDVLQYSFRDSGEETELTAPFSRHYECYIMARTLSSGVSVAWPYWYGGGKHGNPEEIEWVDYAYFVKVEQKTTVVNVYSKVGGGE